MSACEAMWRILRYPICYRTTHVVKLTFHDKGKQPIFIKDGETAEDVLSRKTLHDTMFQSYFDLNKISEKATDLLYEEIPNKFTWNKSKKFFTERKTKTFAIGRINFVPNSIEDDYHLRILLNCTRGATCWEDFKKVNGVIHKSYRDACFARGLLDDDKEYINGIQEAVFFCSRNYVRKLFCNMLLSQSLSAPDMVWQNSWHILSEDITRKKRLESKQSGIYQLPNVAMLF